MMNSVKYVAMNQPGSVSMAGCDVIWLLAYFVPNLINVIAGLKSIVTLQTVNIAHFGVKYPRDTAYPHSSSAEVDSIRRKHHTEHCTIRHRLIRLCARGIHFETREFRDRQKSQ